MTHLMVFMEVCRVDDKTIVFVADPTFGNIVDLDVPRSFWNRLAGKYGNMFYWKEKQRCLHDEVAQCEKTLKTLLNGGQEDLMSKVDSTVEACDDTLSLGVTQTSLEQCQNHVEERSLESFKKRKLSESTLSLDNPCQKLDNIFCENNWILLMYTVLPA